MAITRVQSIADGTGSNASGTTRATASVSVTAGNLLVVVVRYEGGGASDATTVSLSDTAGNTYTQIAAVNSGGDLKTHLFKCENCLGNASNVITATLDTARSFRRICGAEYSGSQTISETGTAVSGQATSGTSVSAGNVTTSAGELLVAGIGYYSSANVTIGSAFSTLVSGSNSADATNFHALEDGLPSAGTNAVDATLSASTQWVIIGTRFVEGAAPPAPQGRGLLLGVG